MKTIMKLTAITLLSVLFMNCSNPSTPAGYEGYVYEDPRLFGSGGFNETMIGPKNYGFSFRRNKAINIDYRPNTFSENYNVLSNDDLKLTVSSHAVLVLKPNTVKSVVENHGGIHWYNRTIKKPLRTYVREAVQKRNGTELKSQLKEVSNEVKARLQKLIDKHDFIGMKSFVIGNIGYPSSISDAVESKLKAAQKLQEKDTQMEIAKKDALIEIEKAKGIAKSQSIINKSLTDRYLQYKAIEAQKEMANSPNHTTVYMPSGANGIPIVHNR